MEKFENLRKKGDFTSKPLLASAMNYDGIWIENEIEGYHTLKVEGREMLAPKLSIQSGTVGGIVSNQRLPERTLEVTYRLVNHDPELLLVDFKNLVSLLYRDHDVEIYFNDERDVIYRGRFSGAETVNGAANEVTSSFEITCTDPRKYSELRIYDEYSAKKMYRYQQKPSKIELIVQNNGKVELYSDDKMIRFNRSFKAGDRIIVNFEQGRVQVNGENKTSVLSLDSDFENFVLVKDKLILCSNGTCKTFFREVNY